MAKAKIYEGPVCYVGHDHESEDGRELQGGFHYTVVESPTGGEMPGEKLVHDSETDKYHHAKADHVSHHELHHKQFADIVPELSQDDIERLRKLLDAQEASDE